MIGVHRALRREMNPLMENHLRTLSAHDGIPSIVIHCKGQWPKHRDDSIAIDINEGLNVSLHARHPADRSHHNIARSWEQGAGAVQMNHNGRFHLEAWR